MVVGSVSVLRAPVRDPVLGNVSARSWKLSRAAWGGSRSARADGLALAFARPFEARHRCGFDFLLRGRLGDFIRVVGRAAAGRVEAFGVQVHSALHPGCVHSFVPIAPSLVYVVRGPWATVRVIARGAV